MKTLDEAVELLQKDINITTANLISSKGDIDNPHIFSILKRSGTEVMVIIREGVTQDWPYEKVMAKLCAQLHAVYALGKTVGILMERQEEDFIKKD